MNLINDEKFDIVVVIGVDYVYCMDFWQMFEVYIVLGVKVIVVGICQLIVLVLQFGVIDVDVEFGWIKQFFEKLMDVMGLDDLLYEVFVLMGNYIFDVDVLIVVVEVDGEFFVFGYDMGGDIVFYFVECGEVGYYDMKQNEVLGFLLCDCLYWCDVGMIDFFFDVYCDLILMLLIFNFYNMEWLIYLQVVNFLFVKFVCDLVGCIGNVIDLIVFFGLVFFGMYFERSVVGLWIFVGGGFIIMDFVVFDYVQVGQGVCVYRVILDKNVVLVDGVMVGVDCEWDLFCGFIVMELGIIVVGKGVFIEC